MRTHTEPPSAPADPLGRLTAAGVAEVEPVIRRHIRLTPVVTLDRAEFGLAPGPLTLKLEFMQHSGSFKARGAFTNLLLRDVPVAGVAAASGGNHGAAVAYAASVLGIPAHIFVPEVSSPAKINRIRDYGADLVVKGETYSDAYAICQEWIAANGALPVHAYDQVETILGAGTTGLELARQVPEATTIVASVGGGGLLSGIATAVSDRTTRSLSTDALGPGPCPGPSSSSPPASRRRLSRHLSLSATRSR